MCQTGMGVVYKLKNPLQVFIFGPQVILTAAAPDSLKPTVILHHSNHNDVNEVKLNLVAIGFSKCIVFFAVNRKIK